MSPQQPEDLAQLVVLWEMLTNSRLAQKLRADFLADPDAIQLAALLRSVGRDTLVAAGAPLAEELLFCETCCWAFKTRTPGFEWHLCAVCGAKLGWMSPYRVLGLRDWRLAVERRVCSQERSAAYAAFLVDCGEDAEALELDILERAEPYRDEDEWGDSIWPALAELDF